MDNKESQFHQMTVSNHAWCLVSFTQLSVRYHYGAAIGNIFESALNFFVCRLIVISIKIMCH